MKRTLNITLNASLDVTGLTLIQTQNKSQSLEEALSNILALGFGNGAVEYSAMVENETIGTPPPPPSKDDIQKECQLVAEKLRQAKRGGASDAEIDAHIAKATAEIMDKYF